MCVADVFAFQQKYNSLLQITNYADISHVKKKKTQHTDYIQSLRLGRYPVFVYAPEQRQLHPLLQAVA